MSVQQQSITLEWNFTCPLASRMMNFEVDCYRVHLCIHLLNCIQACSHSHHVEFPYFFSSALLTTILLLLVVRSALIHLNFFPVLSELDGVLGSSMLFTYTIVCHCLLFFKGTCVYSCVIIILYLSAGNILKQKKKKRNPKLHE